jgi:hypothetical protein
MNLLKPIFSVLIIGMFLNLNAQEECKVFIPEIAAHYKGKCKKGLAHGKGIAWGIDTFYGKFVRGYPEGKGRYIWANGDSYVGMFEKGRMHGEGILHYTMNDADSVLTGIWKEGKYKGPKPKAPKVLYSTGVQRQSFSKYSDHFNKIEIKIVKSGSESAAVRNFLLTTTSGTINGRIVEEVRYPVKIKIRYETQYALDSRFYPVEIEFEIYEEGSWLVTIYNS